MEITTRTLSQNEILPLCVEPADGKTCSTSELIEWISNRLSWIDDQLHHHGGILFRGFSVPEPDDFQRIAQTVIPQMKPYIEGQSPRTKVQKNVYTSTEYPSKYRITLHNELSYTKSPPRRLAFYCHVPASSGGETPVVDCRTVYREMDADLREKFEKKGVRYVKNMHGEERGLGKSWMGHFETSERSEVEKHLRENGIDFEWTADNTLRTQSIRPSVVRHPVTGEMMWQNQADLWHVSNFEKGHREQLLRFCSEENLPTHAYFGDGTPITEQELDRVREILWREAVVFSWKQGDILLLDNMLVAHGRMPYDGPRKILVAMG